jgi:cytochrome b pre-mRNA-processing protein 3
MQLLRRLFGTTEADPRESLRPLYNQLVAHARQPHWYLDGGIPDSVNGRFEMVATMFALVLLRLEQESDSGREMALLTEIFVADMDAQLREIGVGDMIVGKRVGKLVGAFGGRLGVYRDALTDVETDRLAETLRRNLYGDVVPDNRQISHVAAGVRAIWEKLGAADAARLIKGDGQW